METRNGSEKVDWQGPFCSSWECHQKSSEGLFTVEDHNSTQKEADTRIPLHLSHAVRSLTVASEDTDVFILCVSFQRLIPSSIFLKCGTQTRVRYINIKSIVKAMAQNLCSLLGIHAYTGCVTVSAYAGREKIWALRILKEHKSFQEMFDLLGVELELSDDLVQKLQDFTCQLYISSPGTNSVNELRYRMFCSRRGNIEFDQLLPCADCLSKHACRANYQTAIWRQGLENRPEIPSPLRHGWTQEENRVGAEWMRGSWMSGQPAPTAVLELLSCSCTRSCKLRTGGLSNIHELIRPV